MLVIYKILGHINLKCHSLIYYAMVIPLDCASTIPPGHWGQCDVSWVVGTAISQLPLPPRNTQAAEKGCLENVWGCPCVCSLGRSHGGLAWRLQGHCRRMPMYSGSLTLFSTFCFHVVFLPSQPVIICSCQFILLLKMRTPSFLGIKYSSCILGIWKSPKIVILEDGTTLCFYPSTLMLHMMMSGGQCSQWSCQFCCREDTHTWWYIGHIVLFIGSLKMQSEGRTLGMVKCLAT